MNPIIMQYKLILQNIDMMDNVGDLSFELHELGTMTKQDYSKEIKFIQDPNLMGKPKKMRQAKKMITKKFKQHKVKLIKTPHHHQKTDIQAPTKRRKSYSQAHHLNK